jgi:hypothetical protein
LENNDSREEVEENSDKTDTDTLIKELDVSEMAFHNLST